MQTSLFPEITDIVKQPHHLNEYVKIYETYGFRYEYADVKDVTFKAGMNESVHSWFRLTPSYSPELVRYFFNDLKCTAQHVILEPFTGKGTTLIEAQKYNFKAIGIEINPLLKQVSEYALEWHYDVKRLRYIHQRLKTDFAELYAAESQHSLEDVCSTYNLEVPKIHNPYRWWQKDILRDLLILKKLVLEIEEESIKPFWLALCVISLDCANIHRNHPTISFDDNHSRHIKVWNEFDRKIKSIIDDLQSVGKVKTDKTAEILLGDSTKLDELLGVKKVNRVITSPPYPNRFSYIHTTRPQLFFMGIISDAKKATEIDIDAIGGTWGRATSILDNVTIESNPEIKPILNELILSLQPKSLLMCNYAVKYFNLMHNHIKSLKSFTSDDFKGVYVVGNSRLSGVEVHTEILLAKIFQQEGFTVDKIIVFRKRGGKMKLYETGVCVSR
jgi:DNA modification methylase